VSADDDVLPEELKGAIRQAIVKRAANDNEGTLRCLSDIESHGAKGLFFACAAWARLVNRVTGAAEALAAHATRADCESPKLGFQVVDDEGKSYNPDALPADAQPAMWAHRFIVAQANDDADQAVALFLQQDEHDPNGDCILALLDLATFHAAWRFVKKQSSEMN
jgi:hypothetical protein